MSAVQKIHRLRADLRDIYLHSGMPFHGEQWQRYVRDVAAGAMDTVDALMITVAEMEEENRLLRQAVMERKKT